MLLGWVRRLVGKDHTGTFRGDGTILCVDLCDDHISIYIHQHTLIILETLETLLHAGTHDVYLVFLLTFWLLLFCIFY